MNHICLTTVSQERLITEQEWLLQVWDFNSYHGDMSSYWGLLYSGSVVKKNQKAEQKKIDNDVIISQTC